MEFVGEAQLVEDFEFASRVADCLESRHDGDPAEARLRRRIEK
jgi:hypothetical protein